MFDERVKLIQVTNPVGGECEKGNPEWAPHSWAAYLDCLYGTISPH